MTYAPPPPPIAPAPTSRNHFVAWIRRHKVISIIVGVFLALCIVGAIGSYNKATLHNSLSYKDGYSWGTNDALNSNTVGWRNGESAQSYCKIVATPYNQAGNVPTGDDIGQWTAGCIDGYSEQTYQNAHPGA